jgi:uncharacterized surface protein with fasciclin (FAS1) repeats
MTKIVSLYALLISAMLLVGICSGASNSMTPSAGEKKIVDTAVAAGNFKTFVTALQTAGLADTLKGNGPFTIFAPTDEAFAKIPKDQLDSLMANKTQLAALLAYHVAPGKFMSADLKNGMMIKTIPGESLIISLTNGDVMANNAKVVQVDIIGTNGVIHAIDTILIPLAVAKTSNLNLSKSNINRMKANSTNNATRANLNPSRSNI